MYMVPPFLAFYGADKNDETLLHESFKQCGYYRQVLLRSNTTQPYKGTWEHIIGPNNKDLGIWSTGNAWAAGGMTRVLATIMKAPAAQTASWTESAIVDLTTWIMDIVDGAMASSMDAGLLRNYYDNMDPSTHGFGEISGSSLLAAVVYRMAALRPDVCTSNYISWADGIRSVLGGKDANGNRHVTPHGIATPAVNPMDWLDTKARTTGSPEGQVFVVLMYAAWRDCVLVGPCTAQDGVLSRRALKRRLPVNLES
jgi:rhamnogalacturonyl hydrolase YesR